MDKKGLSFPVEFLPNIGFTIIAFTLLIGVLLYFGTYSIETDPVKRELISSRVIYSPHGISHTSEETGRTYPGIVEPDRVTDEVLKQAINYSSSRQAAVEVALLDKGRNEIRKAHLNEDRYDIWYQYAEAGVEGWGSASLLEKIIPVKYVADNEYENGFVRIRVVTPNS